LKNSQTLRNLEEHNFHSKRAQYFALLAPQDQFVPNPTNFAFSWYIVNASLRGFSFPPSKENTHSSIRHRYCCLVLFSLLFFGVVSFFTMETEFLDWADKLVCF
jgi:hypothetical protein